MSRRAAVAMAVAGAVVCIAYVAAFFTMGAANTIDDVWWKGDPVPPCFVDAALCGGHLLGTDLVGRDILIRLVAASGTSLGTALLAALVACVIALVLGAAARHGGRAASYLVQRATEGMTAIPRWPLLVLAVVALSSRENGVPQYCLAIIAGAILWPKVTALTLAGRPPTMLVSQGFRDWASAILMLAMIDFLGWGIQEPMPTWGSMLGSMQETLQTGWWSAIFPAVPIFVAVLVIEWAARGSFEPNGPAEEAVRSTGSKAVVATKGSV